MTATEANIKSVKVGDARSEPLGSSSTSLEEQTHSLLGAMIKDGRIRPGDRLVEAQIVKAFGVSRSPARRALQTLHREGVIVHDEHGYAAAGTSTPTTRRLATLQPARLLNPGGGRTSTVRSNGRFTEKSYLARFGSTTNAWPNTLASVGL